MNAEKLSDCGSRKICDGCFPDGGGHPNGCNLIRLLKSRAFLNLIGIDFDFGDEEPRIMAYIDSVDARGVESRTHTAEGQFESGRNGSLLCLAYTGVLRS